MGSPVTYREYWKTYTPVKEVVEVFDYTDEGWKEAVKREKELIVLDLHNPLCLNTGYVSHNSLRVNSECVKEFWSKEENRASHSEKMKLFWSNNENRQSLSRKMKEFYKDNPEARAKNSQIAKDLWESSEHRERMSKTKRRCGSLNHNSLTEEEVKERLRIIENSGINLQVYGWVEKVSKLLGISHTRVRVFFKNHWKGPAPFKRSKKTA